MSENLNPFDKLFRQRLTDLESSVPDDLFDRLQARRGAALPSDAPLRERVSAHETPVSNVIFDAVLAERERRKRRRVIFWRSMTAVAAALLLLFVAIEFKHKKTISVDKSAKLNSVNSAKNEANKGLSNTHKIVDYGVDYAQLKTQKTIDNNVNAVDLNNDKTIKNNENTEGSKNELKIQNSKLNAPNSELSVSNFELNNSTKPINNNTKKQQIIINKKARLNENKNAISNQKNAKIQSNNLIAVSVSNKLSNENVELKSVKKDKNSDNTEGADSKLEIENKDWNTHKSELKTVLENRLSSPNFPTPTLDFLHILSTKTVALPTENRKNPCNDPGNGCPTFIGKRRMNHINYYVDAFAAPEYMMRRFKTNLPENEKLLAARDSSEKVQYAVSAGVRGSVVFGNGISLRAGLVFNQMNERVQFDSFGIGGIKTTYDVRIVNGKPDTVSITTVITDGIFRKTRYNHYRSIDIPLQIGCQMRMKNGWTLGFNGGANFNITAWQKADILGANLQKQTVSSGINEANPVFRNQLGISIIGSVAAYRQLTNGLELMIEPSVRYGLQPITRSDYALKQQYSTAGLIIGLRLRL